MAATIILPYLFRNEIDQLILRLGYDIDYIAEEDTSRIGSDLMYQRLWKKCNTDIFIMHADMLPLDSEPDWWAKLQAYVSDYPETGLFGLKLLYPKKNDSELFYIQSAGGKFTNNKPDHYGSGIDLMWGRQFKEPEQDKGQYDKIREVAWTTFGGVYIRREVINQVGDFDSQYEWSYNRDVDWCLSARKAGWKIYQLPIPLLHFESRDNKRLRASNPEFNDKEFRNLQKLQTKWSNTEYYKTIDRIIEE